MWVIHEEKQTVLCLQFCEWWLWISSRIIIHLRSYVKHSTRWFIRYANSSQKNLTASRFFDPALFGVWTLEQTLRVDLLLETPVKVFIWYPNTGIEFRKEKKSHERHNQGIKTDFEVRVSDIQSSLTKVTSFR